MKVSNREGIANQTGPESCVAHREVRDEALTGEPAGQPLSRESFKLVQGADAVSVAEGNTDRRDKASACTALRGLRRDIVKSCVSGLGASFEMMIKRPVGIVLRHRRNGRQ